MGEIAETYGVWDAAFQFFNERLFDGDVEWPIFTIDSKAGAHGYFHARQWFDKENKQIRHQLSMTRDSLAREDKESMATFVHEMCHLHQFQLGNKSKGGYHDKQWAAEMHKVGLVPRSIDNPGKETGRKVTHDIPDEGPFVEAWQEWEKLNLRIKFAGAASVNLPEELRKLLGEEEKRAKAKRKSKTKYTCPACEVNIWGKPGIVAFHECGEQFEESE